MSCVKVNASQKNQPSDEHGSFPVIEAWMKRLLQDSCVLWIFNCSDLPCLARLDCLAMKLRELHCTHFGIVARMFFSTKNNQQRIPSQYVDLSCYAEVWYLNNGYFGLWLTYVSILLESLESRVFFRRDYDALVVFPWWTCVKITGWYGTLI